jgi:hypothetical protein
MNETLMQAIGVTPNPNACAVQPDNGWPAPRTMISWALYWQSRGLKLFPCTRFTGRPLVPNWPKFASDKDAQIVEWWSDLRDADIAAVPDAAGCFVIVATGDEGYASLDRIEPFCGEPLLATEGADASLHRWFAGRAPTQRLHHGLYVFGVGSFLYMPGSLAPQPVAPLDREAV